MFCTNCGKEIPEEGACFCPNCGSNVGHSANEKMKTYTGKAVETAQDFVGDIKQVVKDKDTAGFLKRNKHRNLKIIIGIMVVLFVITDLSRGNNNAFRNAEDKAVAFTSSLTDVKNTGTSNIELAAYDPNSKGYMLWISVGFTTDENEKGTALYLVGMDKDDNITSSDAVDIILPSDKKKLKSDIENAKDFVKSKGMEIK